MQPRGTLIKHAVHRLGQYLAGAALVLAASLAQADVKDWPAFWRGVPDAQTRTLLDQAFAAFTASPARPDAELYGRAATALESLLAKTDSPSAMDADARLRNGRAWMFLGELRSSQRQYEQGLAAQRKGLALLEATLSGESLELAAALRWHANTYVRADRRSDSLPIRQRVLAISEKVLGPEHPETATSLNNLAELYKAARAYDVAEPLYVRALAIHEKVLGPEHLNISASLDNLAGIYVSMRAYAKAEPLYVRALAVRDKALGPEHRGTLTNLNNLAGLYELMGAYAKAEPLYLRALATKEKSLGRDHPDTAISMNNLAALYAAMGAYGKAAPLYTRALEINETVLGPEHPNTATSLNNLASVYKDTGAYAKAERLYARAIAIDEKALGLGQRGTVVSSSNLAGLYLAMGLPAKSEPLYTQALAIVERARGPEHPDTAIALTNLGVLHESNGAYAKAEPLLRRALTIDEKALGPEHPRTSTDLSNLAALYFDMGATARAEPLFERALAIDESALGREHPHTATSLSNLAALYRRARSYEKAEPLYVRALAIRETVLGPEHPDTAATLNSLAALHRSRGEYGKAEPLFARALAIRIKVLGPDHPAIADSLNQIASLFVSTRAYAKAEQLYTRARSIALRQGNPDELGALSSNLAIVQGKQGNPELAIFYAKQAVSLMENQRKAIRGLDSDLQRGYLSSRESIYRDLAGWLVAAGRLGEAEQILELLRGEELRELSRGMVDDGATSAKPVKLCVGSECTAHGEHDRIAGRLGEIARGLEAMVRDPDTFDAARKAALLAEQARLLGEFEVFLGGLQARLASKDAAQAERTVDDLRRNTAALSSTLASLGPGTVALRYLVLPEQLYILVVTSETQFAREVKLGEKDLNQLVANLRQALLRRTDDKAAAQALYARLIEPVAADLKAATRGAAQPVLMIAPDKSLGMLPFAALHDGQRYLIEHYALAQFNDAVRDNLQKNPGAARQRAFGLTRAAAGQPALPSVREELSGLGRSVPGDAPLLDDAFTEQSLKEAFDRNRARAGSHPIIHVASHFSFNPGDEFGSGLVLGDGKLLSLLQIKGWKFVNTELLTLSACQTAESGGTLPGTGLRADGFGQLAQQNGAHAVLATLWSVNDAATGDLMQRFYALRYGQGQAVMNKAQALRQAQMALINGARAEATTIDTQRAGSAGEAAVRATPTQQALDPQRPHAHPYYWAPFVLMGNWL